LITARLISADLHGIYPVLQGNCGELYRGWTRPCDRAGYLWCSL